MKCFTRKWSFSFCKISLLPAINGFIKSATIFIIAVLQSRPERSRHKKFQSFFFFFYWPSGGVHPPLATTHAYGLVHCDQEKCTVGITWMVINSRKGWYFIKVLGFLAASGLLDTVCCGNSGGLRLSRSWYIHLVWEQILPRKRLG